MKYLIAGASGQLARTFISRFEQTGADYVAPPETDLDIGDLNSLRTAVAATRPTVLLNCAAYNAVDLAETDTTTAMKVNAEGVRNLAVACREHGVLLVHYSSDYVFDGTKQGLYVEGDAPNPLNRYGESKWRGERHADEETERALILRLSWVYGPGPQNFLHKLMKWSESKDVLRVVYDQLSVPTYTGDIVEITLRALDKGLHGLFHLTNTGYASRYEAARHFFRLIDRPVVVLPVPTSEFPSPATRPFFTAMSNDLLRKAADMEIPSWEEAMERALPHLGLGLPG